MQHVISSWSTFLPNIIKIFQRVFKLQSGQEVLRRRDPSQKQYVPTPFGTGDIITTEQKYRSHWSTCNKSSILVLHGNSIPSTFSASGRGTTDAIFVVRQLQEKYLAANKRLYMAFVDLEKAFDRVPRKVIYWALRKLDVEEWIVRRRVWSEGWCSPRIYTQPTALHHCAWSLITRVPLWGPLGGPLCRWSCYHRWIAWGMYQEALDLERSNGEERTESKYSKCRKDKDHDLRYSTGPPAEFRWVSMRCLSHWSRQQQHLLQWLQALGAQEMQWAQALEKGPWL